MTDTVSEFVAANDQVEPSLESAAVEQKLIDQLVEQARSKGLQLTGEGGLLQQLTKTVLESALEGEITGHLGYDKHDPAGKDGGNSRNGTRSKTVLTDIGPVEIDVPRDREGSFEPAVRAAPADVGRPAPQASGGRGRPADRRDAAGGDPHQGCGGARTPDAGVRIDDQLPAGQCDMRSLQVGEDSRVKEESAD